MLERGCLTPSLSFQPGDLPKKASLRANQETELGRKPFSLQRGPQMGAQPSAPGASHQPWMTKPAFSVAVPAMEEGSFSSLPPVPPAHIISSLG